ncbi:hypothetical protein PSECIP111951_02440 [Pseudoalteromonas holothuriae]|uniref:Uncharacterized protein n=1 Tax=Pseudoalteromonas holothuriae TaxID=2963714 RepID=A0ABN8UMC7_9GAMM|nr:hypothetical protein [Pseudoalteromonas sp. CIP111951]CAH9061214.1 hypothetical protein PSECIP111951_02440 [Pseudoalteromonas sp. CIP111951]
MKVVELGEYLRTGWEKLGDEQEVFLHNLHTEMENIASLYEMDVNIDKAAFSNLFLKLVANEHTSVDILSYISADSSKCKADKCMLFSTAVNSSIKQLDAWSRFSEKESLAFRHISQKMCFMCTKRTKLDVILSKELKL